MLKHLTSLCANEGEKAQIFCFWPKAQQRRGDTNNGKVNCSKYPQWLKSLSIFSTFPFNVIIYVLVVFPFNFQCVFTN
jgi:hypothetical protein